MNVVVALNNGEKIYPSYSAESANDVLSFYSLAVVNSEIAGFVAKFNDGSVIAEGYVL